MPCQSRDDSPRRVVGANAGFYSCTDILFALLFIANLVPLCHASCRETYERRRLDATPNLSCGRLGRCWASVRAALSKERRRPWGQEQGG